MRELASILAFAALLIGSMAQSRAQTAAPTAQAAVARAEQLDQQAVKLYGDGKVAEAIPLAEQSLAIKEQALGTMHPKVGTSLNNLATLYLEQGAFDKVEPLLLRALAIKENSPGPQHPTLATSLNNLASLYHTQGAFAKAEPLYLRALAIDEKALSTMHPEVATNLATNLNNLATDLNNLATLYLDQGAFAKAEPLYLRSIDIHENARSPQHLMLATSLTNLANLYLDQGAFAKAEPLYLRSIDIYEKALGPLHPALATSLNNLANLYLDQGAFAKAEPLLLRAIDIQENAPGIRPPNIAASFGNLAALYLAQGAFAEAVPFLLRALDVQAKALGPWHPDLAPSLNILAEIYQALGVFTKAELFLHHALRVQERALGPRHPALTTTLNRLAGLYQAQGAFAKAEPLLLRALDTQENALGPWHPDLASSLNNLATLYQAQGAFAKAEPRFLRAVNIREKALGPVHPTLAIILLSLAVFYQAQRDYAKAEPLFVRATDIRETQLRTELSRLPEPRKRALMRMLRGDTETVVSFHAHNAPMSTSARNLALTTVLRNKGRVLDSLADNQAALRASLTPALREQLDQLTDLRTQLTAQLYHRKASATSVDRTNEIAALRARIDALESSLSAASAEFRSQAEPVTLAKVQAALPPGSALVELVQYRRFDARGLSRKWRESRYLAYVVRPTGPPTWVALGEAAPIDAVVAALRAGMHRELAMPQKEIAQRQQQARAALEKLHGLLMAPLATSLQGVSHLLIAPDGELNLVPFEALIDATGNYVLQRHLVSYLSSGRDLLRLATQRRTASAPTIVAAPDYGPGKPFAALPGAMAEGQALRRAFPQGQLLTGRGATKDALSKLVGPSLLHVATHGFYARGGSGASGTVARTPPRDPTRGVFIESFDSFESFGSALPPMPPASGDDDFDALDRAGLALAGANTSANGIITAREIAGLDWSGTQLVVLSACETGVGAVAAGEGVYGLRRALVLSGAESQVVSLWNVADASTLGLMKAFYAELARGAGRAEALRRAKLALLQEPRYAHPFYWAAFIPAGDWRPLDPSVFAKAQRRP